MIKTGDKNVNVVAIINELHGKKMPTNDGVEYDNTKEDAVQYLRDPREHNPLTVINSDETKPVDGDDFNARLKALEVGLKTI